VKFFKGVTVLLSSLLRLFLVFIMLSLLGSFFFKHWLHRSSKWTPGGPLHQAIFDDDLPKAKQLLEQDSSLANQVNSKGVPPILGAKSKEAVDLLIDYGADINVGCDNKTTVTPLMSVIWSNISLAEHYISKGAKIDCKDIDGQTALHDSAKRNRVESVKLLVKNGADINAIDNEGNTPLHIAAGGYFLRLDPLEAVQYLIENGADINKLNNDRQTALDLAIIRGNAKVINFLQKSGAICNVPPLIKE